ncbi:MAG: hypothetical protein A3B96_03175 [Candidatus Spechtbacteria bacterium RIFCSPHIGHO2_02_FULL_43_15b]|uniref:Uncharacterized protein n=1 Tax=Candidatus Spechtbacteria bacterium RIFCSPHIGHO2_01_FULL_43_30 TaxID=1802158 RepID=A0A1G2H8F0_9BACT|nr:MAG: hypothetical protein A2827_00475 [Candidatus Spechtbacteria bacterium RIFCSPHIGHO2_01_FULL_43_30]OGZ59745.1 MAG: hypothetical protein A3B96_03175 [Candidatus Spechtbacteria bacterium RIFCSPHIGHO2_02_FULL_43_15b]
MLLLVLLRKIVYVVYNYYIDTLINEFIIFIKNCLAKIMPDPNAENFRPEKSDAESNTELPETQSPLEKYEALIKRLILKFGGEGALDLVRKAKAEVQKIQDKLRKSKTDGEKMTPEEITQESDITEGELDIPETDRVPDTLFSHGTSGESSITNEQFLNILEMINRAKARQKPPLPEGLTQSHENASATEKPEKKQEDPERFLSEGAAQLSPETSERNSLEAIKGNLARGAKTLAILGLKPFDALGAIIDTKLFERQQTRLYQKISETENLLHRLETLSPAKIEAEHIRALREKLGERLNELNQKRDAQIRHFSGLTTARRIIQSLKTEEPKIK